MKVLLACEFYHPSKGGVQEVIRQIAERLVERGHEVTVATTALPARASTTLNGVRIVEFAAAGKLAFGLSGEVDAYRRFVLESDYDVFMVKAAQQWTFDALWPVLDRMHGPKVLVPCGFSGLYERAFADYFGELPEVLRKFDHLIFYASDYRDINFARESKITRFSIIPNGASEREFELPRDRELRVRLGIPTDAFVVLTVGSLTGAKGHRELAESFVRCKFAGMTSPILLLNGNYPDAPQVAQRMRQLLATTRCMYMQGGLERVSKWLVVTVLLRLRLNWLLRLLGSRAKRSESIAEMVVRLNREHPDRRILLTDLARPELVQAYLNSDLFVFASNVEYSPLVLFEASAAGLPWLSVPVGNAEEIARWTGGGEICPAPVDAQGYTRVDPAVLAEHITRLAADPNRRRALGEAGQSSWSERFTWAKIIDQYESLFIGLLSEKKQHEATDPRTA